jgi:N-acetyl sugar amidotransferase
MIVLECARCIMTSLADSDLKLDGNGVCNHCLRYDRLRSIRIAQGDGSQTTLDSRITAIQKSGRNREFDCIVGVSGGVDSTYVAYLAKRSGLRPLAVHLDNGWDSELAVKNIEQTLSRLDIPLSTYVIDWDEFRDLQLSFLKASVPDIEIPTDHAIQALLWRSAVQAKVKFILSGMNFATEAISVPSWSYGHSDWRYIKDVHRRYGTVKIRSYPHFGLGFLGTTFVRGIRSISVLNYIDYDKESAKSTLATELGWRDYGGKHHESIFTRYTQGVILPQKFGIDKRIGHLSDEINSSKIKRNEALQQLQAPTYDPALQASDQVYVLKKLRLSDPEFQELMALPVRSFGEFRNSYRKVQLLRDLVNALRARGLYDR